MKKRIIERLRKLILYLEKKWGTESKTNNLEVTSLAPKALTEEEDIKTVQVYLDHLKAAVDSSDIRNIALTGNYGSGKSTILKTFESLHPEYTYLNISLASFNSGTSHSSITAEIGNKSAESDPLVLERKIEISILQQIFYRVAPSKIPDSRFKRIINLKSWKIYRFSILFTLWIYSVLVLFKLGLIEKLNPSDWKSDLPIDWTTVIVTLLFILGVGLAGRKLFLLFRNSKINRVNIKGEIVVGESDDKSIFNQHIEEILYFFERTDYNIVIIEDIDRFDNTDIFTKLREINTLVNSSELIPRKIKFIYAIKDEVFQDKSERVKFFDYIIPVIPYINPSNAGDLITKLIDRAESASVETTNFVSDVMSYIDDIDMRLLVNIFTEYKIYRERLGEGLDTNKLFSIIIYKNIDPKDFGALQKREGNLFDFFDKKGKYIELYISNRERELESAMGIMGNLEKELDTLTTNEATRQHNENEIARKETRKRQLHKEIDGYQQEKKDVGIKSISKLFKTIDIEPHLEQFEKHKGLIRTLLVNGHITG